MADDTDADAVLSDVDEDPAPAVLSSSAATAATAADERVRDLLAELEQERLARKSAEDARSDLHLSLTRLKAFAQDVLKKRDDTARSAAADLADALRLKDDALKQAEEALRLKDGALREKEAALAQKDSLRSELETAAHMLVTGMDKISGKVTTFKNFGTSLPRSQKYTGMPAVSYGVIKRANEIVEELVRHVDAANKSRDESRELVEQRNYEIAIEVSQLEATIAGLRDDVSKLEKALAERDARISAVEREFAETADELRSLEAKVESQRPVLIDQMSNLSKAYHQIQVILSSAGAGGSDQLESSFVWQEMGFDENLRTSLEGAVSIYELAKVAEEKVRETVEGRSKEVKALNEKVARLLAEKHHIGGLLRSVLGSNRSETPRAAENGLREVGIDVRLNGHDQNGLGEVVEDEVYTLAGALENGLREVGIDVRLNGHDQNGLGEVVEDEVYTLAGALENTVKSSQLEIIELQHVAEALRAESTLLKAHLEAQMNETCQLKIQIKELEEKERVANESVEGLMVDIAGAEEEIARWKAAAEQEAAAGSAVEQEFVSQLSALRKELEEMKQAMVELEKKLKLKEESAAAAMAARDAAENSLRLADLRSTRLREKLEELTQQLEQSDSRTDTRAQNSHRYMCWPWQWLGLNIVRYRAIEESSNEMELSEPLV